MSGLDPDEQAIVDKVAERKGREYAEKHVEGILAQARLVGDLPHKSGDQDESEGEHPD